MLKILDLHWHWGIQRGLSAGDWHNHHRYRQWKDTGETRDKETSQEATYSLLLKHLQSIIIFHIIVNHKQLSIWKSFLDILTPFVTILFISFESIITAWASEIWLGHQRLFLPSPQVSPASTSETQYSLTVLILLALCAVFGALIFRSYATITSWIFNTSVTISVSFINLPFTSNPNILCSLLLT